MVGWMVRLLDGWMVKKFSSTLRTEMDPRPELREVKPRSARNENIVTTLEGPSKLCSCLDGELSDVLMDGGRGVFNYSHFQPCRLSFLNTSVIYYAQPIPTI